MSVLSEWDIVKELGKGIFIYPFNGINNSLSGCCLKLTASEQAYSIESIGEGQDEGSKHKQTKSLVETKTEGVKSSSIVIKKGETALVWTNESIILNGYFCGSVHAKVSIAARGLGHIGTRVNPYWQGVLSIAIHNVSNEDVKIDVGETIAYLRFYRLKNKSSEKHSNSEQKTAESKLANALPSGCPVPEGLRKWIDEEKWRNGDQGAFYEVLEKKRIKPEYLTEYEKAQREWCRRYISFLPKYTKIRWLEIGILIATFIGGAAMTKIIDWIFNTR